MPKAPRTLSATLRTSRQLEMPWRANSAKSGQACRTMLNGNPVRALPLPARSAALRPWLSRKPGSDSKNGFWLNWMVGPALGLIGVQIFCFRRFCQPLIHIEPQGTQQIAREGLQEFRAPAGRGGIPPSRRNRSAKSPQGPGRFSPIAVAMVLAMSRR